MDSQTVNPLLTAKIVGSYLRNHTVGASELPELITTVYRSLRELGRQAPVEEVLTPAVSLRQSVRLRGLSGMRASGKGPTPPYQQPTRLKPG